MSQTSYDMDQPIGVAGLLADASGSPKKTATYINPDDEIPFGRAVAKDSATDSACKLPDGAGVDIVGIAVRDSATEESDATAENAYATESAVAVLRRGRIYVVVEEAVTPDDAVFVRHTANGLLTSLGIFRTDNDGGNALEITSARYVTSAGLGELAIVDINLD